MPKKKKPRGVVPWVHGVLNFYDDHHSTDRLGVALFVLCFLFLDGIRFGMA
jgi:hypothetical protein